MSSKTWTRSEMELHQEAFMPVRFSFSITMHITGFCKKGWLCQSSWAGIRWLESVWLFSLIPPSLWAAGMPETFCGFSPSNLEKTIIYPTFQEKSVPPSSLWFSPQTPQRWPISSCVVLVCAVHPTSRQLCFPWKGQCFFKHRSRLLSRGAFPKAIVANCVSNNYVSMTQVFPETIVWTNEVTILWTYILRCGICKFLYATGCESQTIDIITRRESEHSALEPL